jgi:catechol 2,3-dioxygenase-like lactoylglutathione lyase family enzyme
VSAPFFPAQRFKCDLLAPDAMRLANLILPVSDLGKSEAFYRDTLGLKEQGNVPGEFVFFDAGAVTLAIRETGRRVVAGETEISFEVPDVKSAYESLKSKVEFSRPPRMVTGNEKSELYATDFKDPDGHILSITGWVPKPSPVGSSGYL